MESEAKIAKVNKQNSFENTCFAWKMTGSRVTVTAVRLGDRRYIFENPAPGLPRSSRLAMHISLHFPAKDKFVQEYFLLDINALLETKTKL